MAHWKSTFSGSTVPTKYTPENTEFYYMDNFAVTDAKKCLSPAW